METAPNTELLVKRNKRLKTSLIILSIVFLVTLAVTAWFLIKIFFIPLYQNNEAEQTETTTQEIEDVSKYTDIELKSYEGLGVNVFEGFDESYDAEDPEQYIPGIVTYYQTDWANSDATYDEKYAEFGPLMYMAIVNSMNITNDVQQGKFDQAKEDIINKNLEANYLDLGYLDPFRNFLGGEAVHNVIGEIGDVTYPNTDYTFALYAVGGYQDLPYASPSIDEDFDINLTVFVFAVKGDNLISLEIHDSLDSLDVEREKYIACFEEEESDEYSEDYEGYFDTSCLAKELDSTKYEEKAKRLVNTLIDRFELAQ